MDKAIEVRDLSYTYPDGRVALKGIDFCVGRGECLALIGPNGAGKTTLLLHLNGLLMSNGCSHISICGMPLSNKNLPLIRQKVGFLFQDPDDQLFMPTVFEDVGFGPVNFGLGKEEVIKRVDEALIKVRLPGYGERSSHHLSYGEKKRISLAAILSMRPEVLILDEPTGNLDPRYRREFLSMVESMGGVTKIIATHDLGLVRDISDRVIIIESGEIKAEGRTPDIVQDTELMQRCGL